MNLRHWKTRFLFGARVWEMNLFLERRTDTKSIDGAAHDCVFCLLAWTNWVKFSCFEHLSHTACRGLPVDQKQNYTLRPYTSCFPLQTYLHLLKRTSDSEKESRLLASTCRTIDDPL